MIGHRIDMVHCHTVIVHTDMAFRTFGRVNKHIWRSFLLSGQTSHFEYLSINREESFGIFYIVQIQKNSYELNNYSRLNNQRLKKNNNHEMPWYKFKLIWQLPIYFCKTLLTNTIVCVCLLENQRYHEILN